MLYDVIVIGGGVVGTAIARELSRFDVSAIVLEKEEELAFGVSKSNSGIIHPGTQTPPGSLRGQLCVHGNRLIREIARELRCTEGSVKTHLFRAVAAVRVRLRPAPLEDRS